MSAFNAAARRHRLQKLIEDVLLSDIGSGPLSPEEAESCRKDAASATEKLLSRPDWLIEAASKHLEHHASEPDWWLVSLIEDGIHPVLVHEYLTYRDYLTSSPDYSSAVIALRSLHGHPQLTPLEDYALAPAHVREQVGALLTVLRTLRLNEWYFSLLPADRTPPLRQDRSALDGGTVYVLNNEAFVRLVLDRPGDAERIAEAAIDRATDDPDIITALIDSDTPVLNDGLL